jgi:Histidine phosphatase superfamily (branch 2)
MFRLGYGHARFGGGCLLVASTADLISGGRVTCRFQSTGAQCDDSSVTSAGNILLKQPQSKLKLKHVIVMHRHGDRAPVTKSIGPSFPPTKEVEDLWLSKLISGPNEIMLKAIAKKQSPEGEESLYTGRDTAMIPYGQLTDLGLEQLIDLGRNLRRRYIDGDAFLPGELNDEVIHARSTNTCRTMNSLRGLLLGLYGVQNESDIATMNFPMIEAFPTGFDPMIDSPTEDKQEKEEIRKHILKAHRVPKAFPDYDRMEARMKAALGYTERVNWIVVREQLVCAQSHGLAFPGNLTDADLKDIYELEMWIVKKLFGDRHYNSHAIGAFYSEIRDRILDVARDRLGKHKMSIYSGHDYTLIPFMVGLGVLGTEFPLYAAHVTIEIATLLNDEEDVSSGNLILATLATNNGTEEAANGNGLQKLGGKNLFARFLYNGDEIVLPGCDGPWVPVEEVCMRLLEGATGRHRDQLGEIELEVEDTEVDNLIAGEEPPEEATHVLVTTGEEEGEERPAAPEATATSSTSTAAMAKLEESPSISSTIGGGHSTYDGTDSRTDSPSPSVSQEQSSQ